MPGKINELVLDHTFWNLVSGDSEFQAWLVGRTKFRDRDLILVAYEKWHQRWYRDPDTGRDSETDILLMFTDRQSMDRYALHVENKPDHQSWTENQAVNYRKRGLNRMKKWRYVDFETVILAPLSFINRHPRECSEFDVQISYEDVRLWSPQLRAGANSMSRPHDIAIVGAGIIGICIAARLAEEGLSVTVYDRTGVCEETSSGNAAAFAFSDVLPLAHKGMLKNLPKWLADPLGPLSIPPGYLPTLLPWLWRFWRAGAASSYESALVAQAGLMRLAEAEWMALMDRSGTRHMLREDGSLELYESESEFLASQSGWQARERHGIAFRHVEGAGMEALQPGLAKRFVKGTFVPGWKTVADPKLLGKAIWAYAESKGARFENATVNDVSRGTNGIVLNLSDGTTRHAAKVVIAAGAWSHRLAVRFGDRIPLETERGYNTTLPVTAFDVRRQLIFSGHGFVVTPLSTGLRVGGAVELGGLDRPPNYARSKAMLAKAQKFLPGLDPTGGREWMGYRPSLPDSVPVIGRARGGKNVFYAFGHGHLGLTQAAATAALIGSLVVGQAPALDLGPFSPQRF